MLCTRCHHDIHRHGWGIRAYAGGVEFVPPPDVDPAQKPRPGGLAAILLGGSLGDGDGGGASGSDESDDSRENSVSIQGWRGSSARGETGGRSAA